MPKGVDGGTWSRELPDRCLHGAHGQELLHLQHPREAESPFPAGVWGLARSLALRDFAHGGPPSPQGDGQGHEHSQVTLRLTGWDVVLPRSLVTFTEPENHRKSENHPETQKIRESSRNTENQGIIQLGRDLRGVSGSDLTLQE